MYRPRNFRPEELIHPQIIGEIGVTNALLRLNELALIDLDYIRDGWYSIYGSGIYINRLNLGLDSRGLRPPDDPDGSKYSGHKKGDTFDLEPVNGRTEELFRFIFNLIKRGQLGIFNTLEAFTFTRTWVHVGYLNTSERPLIIKP